MLKFFGLLVTTAVLVGELRAISPNIPIDKALIFRPIGKKGTSWILNANHLVDAIFARIKSEIPDKRSLSEIRNSFRTRLWFMKIDGHYHLWNGAIWGLQSVHRTGDVKMRYLDNAKTLEIAAAFGATHLWGSYMGHGKVGPITMSPRIQCSIPNLSISAKVCATVVNSVQLSVCGMKITAGIPKLSFHGLHMFNGLADVIANMLLRNMKSKLIRSAEDSLRGRLKKYLEDNRRQLRRQIRNIMAGRP